MKISSRTIAFTALLAAIICAIAPWTVPIGPIPVSLATFGIYIASCVIDAKHGTVATIVYVVLGAIGVPVFSGARGGFGVMAGPTGGYIVGYVFLAVVTGLLIDFLGREKRIWIYPIAMIAGTAVLYAFGTAWYMISTGAGIGAALIVCVLPFLIGDGIKIAAATAVGFPVRRALRKTVLRAAGHAGKADKPHYDDREGK